MLTEQQIPTPGTLEYRRTRKTHRCHPGYACKWATNTVVHILENREYTGCLVNFKTTTQSYKCSKIIYSSEEEQAVFPGHHEPIVDRDIGERVQELRKQDCYICGSCKKRTVDCTAHFIRTDLYRHSDSKSIDLSFLSLK